jgi:hypothetical protein
MLRLTTRDDGPSISSNPPREIVLDEGIYASVLQHQILEYVAHVTCLSIVSIPVNLEEWTFGSGAFE